MKKVELIKPNTFTVEQHYYTKVINASLHHLVSYFLTLKTDQIIKRYCHLNPSTNKDVLKSIIEYKPKYMRWAGADLFYVTTEKGNRKIALIETNSSPSGQKSMPLFNEHKEMGGYEFLIKNSFMPLLKDKSLPKGRLAVLYDKNYMEASGYASALAQIKDENVFLVPFFNGEENDHISFKDGILHIKHKDKIYPIKAAIRYVTQKPWNRIPIQTKTLVYNPTIVCLAGGRNKMVAAKAYDLLNSELLGTGLKINIPETIRDVSKNEIPLWVKRFNGHAVVKVPYSNAGQGVFTITNQKELDKFMSKDFGYDQFIVQSLIGNFSWSSIGKVDKFYHIGTLPNKHNDIYVADLRFMIVNTKEGIRPVALYARRAKKPLVNKLPDNRYSWEILGTNLSVKKGENRWTSDTERLLIMDKKDFNILGIGLDDLIEAYIQAILAFVAIDKMANNLINEEGKFKRKLFKSLNTDEKLIHEILVE
ncbi:MAG: hypothetical protein ABIG89_02670 [Candidatus Woesearchaeota archaeon]